MSVLLSLIACYSPLLVGIDAARILAVFPTPSISHQVVFRPITQELAKRGHEVTVITTDPAFPKGGAPPNLTEIDVHDISYKIWQEHFIKATSTGGKDMISQLEIILRTITVVFNAQIETDEVQQIVNGKSKFDLIFIEACVRPALVFSHVYKNVPVIVISSLGAVPGLYDIIGAADHPLLYPSVIRNKLNNLNLYDKIKELYYHYKSLLIYKNLVESENQMMRKHFGPDVPSVEKLGDNIDLLFLNVHQVFEGIRPVPPSVVYLGGLHQNPRKQLPHDLKSFLDSSKNGVIYFSFGTNVDPGMLPPEKIEILVGVFSQLPYDVLMKWNQEELPGRTSNIRISKWLPQSDLLQHPNIKLFITQGGLQSTDEAITAGVPLIGIPMIGDQWFNVERYVSHKIGVRLDFDNITKENFKNAIDTVIGDESYRQNVLKLRSMMQDEPMGPLDRAVWWSEYVLRHGGAKHLRSPAANLPWSQYFELDVVLIVLLVLSIVTSILALSICLLTKNIYLKCFRRVKVKSS